jgi:hydroxymethylpyrimidine/phosphomethylpyrimidine kinase
MASAVKPPVALTIAGTDSGGGAGILADVKTFTALGVWATAAVVAVTAQNTLGVQAAAILSPELVRAQILAVASDIGIDAAKTGMLGSAELVKAVADTVREASIGRLVVDPVMISKHGDPLLAASAVEALREDLLPLATVVTPNLPEASALVGFEVGDRSAMVDAARVLAGFGPQLVVVKGGHLDAEGSPDLLWSGGQARWLESARLDTPNTHGTGCVFSAALAAELARGRTALEAAITAKRFVTGAIGAGFSLGAGVGPVDPGWGGSP